MHLTSCGSRSVALGISVLIALLVMPGALLAQESDPAESTTPAASAAPELAPPETAKVRFLHRAQAGAMDLYVAEEMALRGLEFGQVSDHQVQPERPAP